MSLRAKVILIFLAVAVAGGIVVWYVVYQARLARGLEMEIASPQQVLIGVPFDLRVIMSNSSQSPLQDVRLTVNLPDGLAFLGSPPAKNVDFKEAGTIGIGGFSQQTFKLIALNGANTFKQITASASYLSGSLSSRFQKETKRDLAVGGYAITLDIVAPQKIFNGENFETEISYKNVSDIDFGDLRLKIDYPITFTLIKATLPPDVGNNIWLLGGLRKGSENRFKITGNAIGPEGASFDVKVSLESSFLGQTYEISANSAAIAVSSSPLSLKIVLNDDPDFAAGLDTPLNYTLAYANNTDVGLRDVIVQAQLIGEMFDFSFLSTNGIFRSTDNTLTWNASVVPQLGTLAPGQSGSMTFSLKTKKAYPIKRLSDKNFVLKVTAAIESPTVPSFVAAERTFGLSQLEAKVRGQTAVDAKVFFRDAASGIVNKGPFPPKVNQPTQYTAHWQIANYGTDVKEIEVRAFLAGNVRFTGVSNTSTGIPGPTYNERTQEVVWQISRIPATVGVISKPLEAIFQIEAMPSLANLNSFMPLIQETSLKAIDEFTDQNLTWQDSPVTTQLPDDTTVISGQGIVQQ